MTPAESSEGEALTRNGAFPPTHWSVVLAAGHAESSAAEAALAEFCRAYWYPLYAYARRSGQTPADAQDLTQGFFGHLLQSQLLARAEAGKGRFRSRSCKETQPGLRTPRSPGTWGPPKARSR